MQATMSEEMLEFQKELIVLIDVMAKTKQVTATSVYAGKRWIRLLCKSPLSLQRKPHIYAVDANSCLGLTFTIGIRSVEIVFDEEPTIILAVKKSAKNWTTIHNPLPATTQEMLTFWEWITNI